MEGSFKQRVCRRLRWNMEMIGFAHSQNVVSENKEKDQFD